MQQAAGDGESIRAGAGGVYAARNVLELCPPARDIWRKPRLLEFLHAALGSEFGLVRGLFFDKPPERTWSLPWHKDLTIAVRDNRLPSTHFSNVDLPAPLGPSKAVRPSGIETVTSSSAVTPS